MSTSLPRKLLVMLLVAGLVSGSFAIAADKATSEKQLKSVLQKIDKLKQAIDVKEDSKSRYIKQLKTIEGDIGALGRKIRALGKEIAGLDDYTPASVEALLKDFLAVRGLKAGPLVNAVRMVTTGQPVGPGFIEVLIALGQKTVSKRLRGAADIYASAGA